MQPSTAARVRSQRRSLTLALGDITNAPTMSDHIDMHSGPLDADSPAPALDEEMLDEARSHLAFLLENAEALRAAPDIVGPLDEIYRAAHALKGDLPEGEWQEITRMARLIQEVVQGARAGTVPVSAGLGTLLLSAARAARDALEEPGSGGDSAAPLSAALTALQALTAGRSRASRATEDRPQGPLTLARVDALRLTSAIETSQTVATAAASLARTADDAAGLLTDFHAVEEKRASGIRELMESLPEALAAAAKGEATTGIAGAIADRVAALAAEGVDFEQALSRFAAQAREAAASGARAAGESARLLSRLGSVPLAAALAGIPPVLARDARRLGAHVAVVLDVGAVEVDAGRAELLRAALIGCARAALAPGRPVGSRRAATSAARELRCGVEATVEDGRLRITYTQKGDGPRAESFMKSLDEWKARLQRQEISLESESQQGVQAAVSFDLDPRRGRGPSLESYVVARAAGTYYALPSAAVEEFVAVPRAAAACRVGADEVPVLRVAGPHKAGAGIVVKLGGKKSVLLFESVEGEETLARDSIAQPDAQPPGIQAASARADGSVAFIVDLPVFASLLHEKAGEEREPAREAKELRTVPGACPMTLLRRKARP